MDAGWQPRRVPAIVLGPTCLFAFARSCPGHYLFELFADDTSEDDVRIASVLDFSSRLSRQLLTLLASEDSHHPISSSLRDSPDRTVASYHSYAS